MKAKIGYTLLLDILLPRPFSDHQLTSTYLKFEIPRRRVAALREIGAGLREPGNDLHCARQHSHLHLVPSIS